MAHKSKTKAESVIDKLSGEAQSAWDALTQIRSTWDDKELALIAKNSDSVSGNVVKTRITDAALSTLAFERQARVAAQLPTGKVYPTGTKDEGKAKLADIVLQRYIIPNANSQFDMLIKQRMWGLYASVYGSMPMLYDYRVDDDYIGPDCWLIDPRSFLPQPGRNSVRDCDWVMISTIMTIKELEAIAERKNTTWNTKAIKKLIELAKDAKPSRYDDKEKDSNVSYTRYSKELAKNQVEIITKYERGDKGHWISFAPDFKEVDVLRDIPNPHKSGKIPVVMRECFPLLNSIYGLGDFDRGMKIQKAKDSFLSLRLEYAKNKVFPTLKIDTSKVTASTIKYGNKKWLVSDMNGVQPVTYGNESEVSFQNVFGLLNGIQQSQFGTSDTRVSSENSSDPSVGKTPAAIRLNQARENARDTWDRFMHEKAVEELNEGLINLLSVKMEKPINFTVFEEEIRKLGQEYGDDILTVLNGNKIGKMTISKKDINSDKGFTYMIDANTSMKQDDQEQLEALLTTYQMAAQDPMLQESLMQQGVTWDRTEHFKKILIAAGVGDWERILQEGQEGQEGQQGGQPTPEQQQAMAEEQALAEAQAIQQQAVEELSQHPALQSTDPEIQAYAQQLLGGE